MDRSIAPAPWHLAGSAALAVCLRRRRHRAPARREAKSQVSTPLRKLPGILGRLCVVAVVRYTQSPVGPYDEILAAEPVFSRVPGFTVTHMYVNSDRSTISGRANWAVPKMTARIDIEHETALRGGAREAQTAIGGGALKMAGLTVWRLRLGTACGFAVPVGTLFSRLHLFPGLHLFPPLHQNRGDAVLSTRVVATGSVRPARIEKVTSIGALMPHRGTGPSAVFPLFGLLIPWFRLRMPPASVRRV